MAHASIPSKYWYFAFDTAIYLINRMPSPVLNNVSHFQCLFQKNSNQLNLKTFGCLCFSYLHPYNRHKVQYRSSPCLFLGYGNAHVGYRCLDLQTKWVYIARHVKFNENNFPCVANVPTFLDISTMQKDFAPSLHFPLPTITSTPGPSIQSPTSPSMSALQKAPIIQILCSPVDSSNSTTPTNHSHHPTLTQTLVSPTSPTTPSPSPIFPLQQFLRPPLSMNLAHRHLMLVVLTLLLILITHLDLLLGLTLEAWVLPHQSSQLLSTTHHHLSLLLPLKQLNPHHLLVRINHLNGVQPCPKKLMHS